MESSAITAKVKTIIGSITGIAPESMADNASFVDDLGLDSLAILEVVVDVEKEFKIVSAEEESHSLRSIQDTVEFISRYQRESIADRSEFLSQPLAHQETMI